MFAMQPAQFPHGGFMEGTERTPGSDQTYPRGTPVTWDTSSQELDEHDLGGTTTGFVGVSLEGVVSGDADNPSGKVNYAKASRSNVFIAKLVNGSGEVQTPDIDNVGVEYGLRKQGSGSDAWFAVDESDTTDTVVEVIGYDEDREVVFLKFLEDAIDEI